jgi:hypothetical protein
MFTDAEAQSRAWTRKVTLDAFAGKASGCANDLDSVANSTREFLADPKMAEPELAAVRDRLVRALLQVSAVAVDAQQEA